MSSTLRVNSLTNADGTGAVNFPHGITGDGSGLDFNPEVIGFNPDLFKSGVAVDTNITISFNQNVQFFGTGTIEIRQGSSSGSIVESFAITSGSPASGLSIVNNQLIINPTADLAINTTFYIILPSQGISNTSEVFYAGSNHYAFTTINETFSMSGGNHEFISANPSSPTGFYKYHIFTGTAAISLSAPSANATDFTSLFVAGGGGGGGYPGSYRAGGGGGAGGLLKRTGPQLGIPAGNYTVVIGAGGEGMGWNPTNTNGQDTVISPPTSPTTYLVRAVGGGAGGYPANSNPPPNYKGNPGGSGGGAYSEATPNQSTMPSLSQGGSGFPGQGNPGGGNMFHSPPGYCQVGGGGGGAGGAGTRGFTDTNSYPTSSYFYGGTGGAGMQVSEFPFTEIFSPGVIPESDFPSDTLERSENGYFAGGGGGGAAPPPGNHYRGQGGIGGGGTGSGNVAPIPVGPPVYTPYPGNPSGTNYAQHGAARLGGGGGGGRNSVPSYRGGRGGSGVAMIRYAYPAALV